MEASLGEVAAHRSLRIPVLIAHQGLKADPRPNRLLAPLSPAKRERWRSHLEAVAMPLGEVLYESGCAPGHVYLPTTSVV